jgi:hypothetical protein
LYKAKVRKTTSRKILLRNSGPGPVVEEMEAESGEVMQKKQILRGAQDDSNF